MMKGGMGNLMKQAQQMQANLQKAQEELALVEVEGQAGSGSVKVLMTCRHQVKRVSIAEAAMNDKEILEDLLVLALNDAMTKVETTTNARMGNMMPAGMKLPF